MAKALAAIAQAGEGVVVLLNCGESPEQLFALATDPQQYDSPGLDWLREGAPDSPSARFFRSYLERELSDLRGAAVIDIGCGTGHLYTLFHALGAARVVGLEPSRRMAAVARRLFPARLGGSEP